MMKLWVMILLWKLLKKWGQMGFILSKNRNGKKSENGNSKPEALKDIK